MQGCEKPSLKKGGFPPFGGLSILRPVTTSEIKGEKIERLGMQRH